MLALLLAPLAAQAQSNTSETYRQLDLFGDVFERVRAGYVEEVSDEQLIEAAITGMLTSLDPHSSYISTNDLKTLSEPLEGNLEGIGVEFNIINDTIIVISTITGGPSEALGVEAGDRIIKIE
ncbi:MAG: peptidase S41, partial [Alphaproteobacteria bacterium]